MPDVVDYLGAPKVVTGADYMHALAALGYNVENMSSPIPTMTKIASAQTNFLDNLYNQNLDRQAKQATLQETLARANNLDSVTDYNNKSLDQRLKALDQENQERDLNLLYQQRTLDSRVQDTNLKAQQAQANLDHDKKIYPLQESELDQKNQQAAIITDALKTQQQGDQDALNEWPMARADLNIPIDDPDFEQKIVDFYRNHPNVATNRQTKAMVDSQVRSMEAARSNLASVQEANNNAKALLGFKATGDLPANTNVDQLKANPDQAHQALVQGTVTQQNRRMSEILAGIGTNPPPELEGPTRNLRDAQERISSILADPDGYNQIARGAWSQFFDANGRLNPTLESEIGALQTYAQERVKQGLAKPMSTAVNIKAGDPTNPSEIRVENVPFGQEAAVAARMQEALKSPEQRAKEAAKLQQIAQAQQQDQAAAIIRANPDIDAMAKEAARTGKGWDKVEAAIAKKFQQQQQSNVPHMQEGGLVQASYTPGSESQMLPGTEPEIQRQVQNAAKAEVLLRPTEGNAPYLGETGGVLQGAADRIDWHNFNFGATQSFSGGPGFYNNPVSGKPYDTGDPALVGARVPMADLTRVLGTDAGSEKSVVSRDVARGFYQVAVVKKDGTLARIPIVDVTPEGKNRGLELTPGAMKMMGAKPGDSLGYRLAFPDGSTIEPSFGGTSPIHDWLRQRDQVRRSRTPGTIALQTGGLVSGTPGPDQVPAMLTDGEYVMNKDAVDNVGLPALEALNAGAQPQAPTSAADSTMSLAAGNPPQQPSAFQQLFGGVGTQDTSTSAPPPTQLPNVPVTSQITPRFPILPTIGPAPKAMPVQTPAPKAQPAQTPTVTTGPATLSTTAPIAIGKHGGDILSKWGPVFDRIAPKYGLDPDILKAISLQENVNPAYNNPLGRSSKTGVYHYTQEEAESQIEHQVKSLTDPHGYYADFVKSGSIYDLAKVYSPVGAKNDVYGTNADEPAGIIANLARIKASTH